jgi:uncharacterized Zn finger protein
MVIKKTTLYCPKCGKDTKFLKTLEGVKCSDCGCVRRTDRYSRPTKIVLFLKDMGFNSTQIRYIMTKRLGMTDTNVYNKIDIYVKRLEIEDAERIFKYKGVKELLEKEGLL